MADQVPDATGPKQATPSTSEQSLSPLELQAQRAWQSVDEEAEEARRLVLGARSRLRPPRMSPAVAEDRSADAGEVGDILRRLAYDVEEETQRLRDEAASLRSEAARAATALHEELQHTNEAIAEQSVEELDREVGPTVAEAVAGLTEQLARLETVTTTLIGAVQRLEPVGPAVDRLAAIAAKPPPEPVTG